MNPTDASFSINEVNELTCAVEQLCTYRQKPPVKNREAALSMALVSSKLCLVKLVLGLSEILAAHQLSALATPVSSPSISFSFFVVSVHKKTFFGV